MSFSSSYLPLDGVEFKVSDSLNPPALPSLPANFEMKDLSQLIAESAIDFSVEKSVLQKIADLREYEKVMAQREEERKQLSIKRRSEAEKKKLELRVQKEVLQQKREEFLEQKRKKQQKDEKETNVASSDRMSPSAEESSAPTYENVQFPPPIPPRDLFSQVGKDNILTPQPAARKTSDPATSTRTNQSQPAVSGQSQIWEDFEDKELDPFTNAELKTIDDLAVLQTVLQNARMGNDLSDYPPSYKEATSASPKEPKTSPSNEQASTKNDSRTPSPDNEGTTSTSHPSGLPVQNILLSELNTKLASKKQAPTRESVYEFAQDVKSSSSPINDAPKAAVAPQNGPIYSQTRKNQPNTATTNANLFINPNFSSNVSNIGQLGSVRFQNPTGVFQPVVTGPNSQAGYRPPVSMVTGSNQSVNIHTRFNRFHIANNLQPNPVLTGYNQSSSPENGNSPHNSTTTSPVVPRASKSHHGVMNPPANTNPKVLPVSFGLTNTPTNNLTAAPSVSLNQLSAPTTFSQTGMVPAPTSIAASMRLPNFNRPPQSHSEPITPSHDGAKPGTTHLLPPYALPTNGVNVNSLSPSSESGFIHKTKQDRAKFTETVNKALSSLPQNPKPLVREKPLHTSVHELKHPTPVARTLSLKSSLISAFSPEEQEFVKNITSMGFDGQATIRAMQKYGLDAKATVEHLIQVQQFVEQGYSTGSVQDALEMFEDDKKSLLKYLQQANQLMDMGFQEDAVREALKSHNNDQAKALDQLMGQS